MSPIFRSNGTRDPRTPAYAALSANDFAAYRLTVTGRVNRPLALSLAQLRSMRSEEHTSELQSLMRISYAVFCLKKKKQIRILDRLTNSTQNQRSDISHN